MKRKLFILSLISLMILLIFCKYEQYFSEDSNPQATQLSSDIIFSAESGFYNSDFYLELTAAPNMRIFFTLDGSTPDSDSQPYEKPILITDSSSKANVYSVRTDISTGFLTNEIARKSSDPPDFCVPDYKVDKCTVVRAIAYDASGNPTGVVSREYFVDFNSKNGYEDLPVVSIVTDPDNLFGFENGIYVTGKRYYDYAASGEESWVDPYWWIWPSNYSKRGREWEREAQIDIFNAGRRLILSKPVGIRIQGGTTRANTQKSFSLYSREEYDGQKKFPSDLFSSGYRAHKLTLFSGADDMDTKLKDYLANTLTQNLNFSTMDFVPCILFLNGEYWGVYHLTEKYDADYIEAHYNVAADDVIIIKNNEIQEGTENDYNEYLEIQKFIENNDMANRSNYEWVCDVIDIDSYIDYYAAEIYMARLGDWPDSNTAFWKTRNTGSNRFYDGKWRWMLFDVNSQSMDVSIRDNNTIAFTMENDAMFTSLLNNASFRKQFAQALMDIGNITFYEETVYDFIEQYTAVMAEPMLENRRRYFDSDATHEYFSDAVQNIRAFFDGRLEYVLGYIAADLQFDPEICQISVLTEEADYGMISVNEMPLPSDSWNGLYLKGAVLTLNARPERGYKFIGWQLNGSEELISDTTMQITLEEQNLDIKAIFQNN